ncbi:MAG: LamG domain-containing protein [Zoogloeaceae bacterium]|jgi:hypothetical protein|nr:LamG domain-containing protein [Zoogloeaceae bacterium]
MTIRRPLVRAGGELRQLPANDTLPYLDTAAFDAYRVICANGTGFRPGAANLSFGMDGTLTVTGNGGAPIEAWHNGQRADLPPTLFINIPAGYAGYVVALPGQSTLTAVESPATLNHRIVAWCGYNPDSPDPWWYAGFEMHTPYRNPDAHLLHHLETGMTWMNGGELTRVHPGDPEDADFTLSNVYVADEDLHFTIENGEVFDDRIYSLLHFDGDLTDEAGAGWTLPAAPAYATGRFGQALDAETAEYRYLKAPALDIADRDFTIEAWVNVPVFSSGENAVLYARTAGNAWGGQALLISAARGTSEAYLCKVSFYAHDADRVDFLNSGMDLRGAGWTHIALTRQGNLWTLWINGAAAAQRVFGHTFTKAGHFDYVGASDLGQCRSRLCQIDEFRFSLAARYTAPFTPPDAPFSPVLNNDANFTQALAPVLQAPTLYIDANGRWAASLHDSPMLPVYNPVDDGNLGGFAQIEDGRFACRWLCFTTCKRYPVKWIMGRGQFLSVSDARQEAFKRLDLPTPEIVAAYQLIIEGDSTAKNGFTVADLRRIGRASRIDDYALTGGLLSSAADNWPLYSLRRAMWPEQIHADATGVWAKLGGDITGHEEAYPLDRFPQLANVVSGEAVVTPQMTALDLPTPALVTFSSTLSPSNYGAWRVFDRDAATSWRSSGGVFTAGGGDEWVQIDLGEAHAAGYLRLTKEDNPHAPNRFILYGTNDNTGVGTAWYGNATALLDVTGYAGMESLDAMTFGAAIVNHAAFRYWRLRVLSLMSASSTGVYLAGIELIAPALSLKSTEDSVGSFLFMKIT